MSGGTLAERLAAVRAQAAECSHVQHGQSMLVTSGPGLATCYVCRGIVRVQS